MCQLENEENTTLNLKLFNFERYRHFDPAERSFLNLLVSIEITWLLEYRL